MSKSIVRVQSYNTDETTLLAVQGKGTNVFMLSNMPDTSTERSDFGVVLSGRIRVTKSSRSEGYFILALDYPSTSDRRRTFFRGDAQVRLGNLVVTMDTYWRILDAADSIGL